MCGFRSLDNSMSNRVLDLSEGYDKVTVVKFRMNDGGGNGAGCFEVKVWAPGKYSKVHRYDSSKI